MAGSAPLAGSPMRLASPRTVVHGRPFTRSITAPSSTTISISCILGSVSEGPAEDRPQTTVKIYVADRAWLQQRQREIGAQRKTWVTMPELLSEFINAIREAENGA